MLKRNVWADYKSKAKVDWREAREDFDFNASEQLKGGRQSDFAGLKPTGQTDWDDGQ
jgi:hypothetical protein